ncbi:ABC-type multidrug transport system, permease component [Serinicoccus hydrothermalis]|uniref:ABC-type multidrug transport system, permease component n=1 Tax=Serinicoccus hydrothermalis TaxID=1758689 RepID=A0A1B1NCM9_9MICO|nr:ABC transporter permease [Serinicoccus hydrothermalis]ANS79187.1 ABC-type multidrug transport system, permease component [Serinicoccus hydrothermalis]
MGRLLVMVAGDLRQQVLDKSFFIFGLAVPLALMWVFSLIFTPLAEELEPITVAVSAPDGDDLAAVVPSTLAEIDPAQLDVTVRDVDPAAAPRLVADGEVGAAVVLPDGFAQDLQEGRRPEVVVHRPSGSGLEADVVTSVVGGVLDQLTASTRSARAVDALGGDPQQLQQELQETSGPAVAWTPGRTADEQLSPGGSIVAGQAGFFLLFTVGFGVLGIVVEREWGTLARVLSTPIPAWWVPLSKGVSSWVLGVVATLALLTAGSVLLDDVDLGRPGPVAVLVLAVVAAATSISFVIVGLARTAEQAGIAQTIVAITLGMSGGAFFRVPSTGTLGQVLQLNPVAALGRGLGITAGGGGVAALGPTLLTLLAFTLVMLLLARFLPGRRELV